MHRKFSWIFAGSKQQGYLVLLRLLSNGHRPKLVFLPNELKIFERKKFYLLCKRFGIGSRIIVSGKIKRRFLARVNVLLTCRFNLIEEKALKALNWGGINIHSSLLPNYRGVHPVSWAIINGENEVGVTVHRLSEGIDKGHVFRATKLKVSCCHNINSVTKDLNRQSARVIGKMFRLVVKRRGLWQGKPQTEGDYFYARRRRVEDSNFSWRESDATRIVNLVRALQPPYPLANCRTSSGMQVRFIKADIFEETDSKMEDGKILHLRDDWYLGSIKGIWVKFQTASVVSVDDSLL
jgi:methionyl-tRNA formyltransferase